MRTTLRWGRNRDHQLIALLGRGGIRAVRLGGLRHHAEKFDHGTGEVRSPVLRHVRRWSFPGRMGNGADSTVVGRSAASSQTKFQRIAEVVSYQGFASAMPSFHSKSDAPSGAALYSSGGSAYQLSPGASGRWAAPPRMKRSRGENACWYWSELMSWSRCSGVRSRMPRIARLTAWRRSGGNCLNC